jgi:glycosyltransferase involved in cell wall biosynthesis
MRRLKGLFTGKRLPAGNLLEHPDGPVGELARKLWSGFSRHARRDLDHVVRSASASADKALAAWELAKFCAVETQWQQALYYLKIIRKVNKNLLRNKEASLLYVETLTACGQSDEAEHYARRKLDKGELGADYYCALSNVMAARAVRQKGGLERDLARLALLNRMYREKDLEEVSLLDPSRGFVFGNLTVAEGCLSAMHRPQKISVLLTVHNAKPLLSNAVSNILSQTWRNLELVIVDDASTDSSWKVVERFATQDSRIVPVRNAVNEGVYQSRNRALSLATGDFIATHDSHDWSHPQMLQTQVQAMLVEPETRLTFPGVACVSPDMKYVLRLDDNSTEYLHRSCRSLFIRRRDLQCLGKWDGVAANADDEFVQRARAIWGDQAARDVLPNVPMSLRLKHSASRRSPGETDFRSLTSGTRHEYARQAEFWRRRVLLPMRDAGQAVSVERVSTKQPFPIPGTLAPKHWRRNHHYNLIIISDLTLLGGTRRCNEGYVAAATSLGMKVGLLHWARYDLRLAADIAKEYRILSYDENVDILTADDRVSADLVIIHHPPIMKYLPDAVPTITTRRLAILVNQLPQRFGEKDNAYYARRDVEAACLGLFGMSPVWIPISPLVRRVLSECGFASLAKEDWIPPLGRIVIPGDNARSLGSWRGPMPVIGRHSRDHRSKWPEVEKDLRAAYCADTEFPVRLLGGATCARRVLSRWPENWQDLAFDSMAVSDFLHALDFFVHFTHSAYVEEFGRNIMEAMAAGMPAVVPRRFREVFGDAACYAEPEEVEDLICSLWNTKPAYVEQVDKGFHFVREFASNESVERRLEEAIHGTI